MTFYSSSWKAHLQHLEVVLKIMQQERLYVKLSKCLFGAREIDYLGHTITSEGVAMQKSKVSTPLD